MYSTYEQALAAWNKRLVTDSLILIAITRKRVSRLLRKQAF